MMNDSERDMDEIELFERVTGRILLSKGKAIEVELKKVCEKTGAEYHEAADGIFISGTWNQVSNTKTIIQQMLPNGHKRSGSSSSDYSDDISVKPHEVNYEVTPEMAKYIKTYCHDELEKIERNYSVKIMWLQNDAIVHIQALKITKGADLFNLACNHFQKLYCYVHSNFLNIPHSTKNGSVYNEKLLEKTISSPEAIVEKSVDRRAYRSHGTNPTLTHHGSLSDRPTSSSSRSLRRNVLMHETGNRLKLIVYQGDITQENTDIIVNACNGHLDHGGGVSMAISKAGGPSVQDESNVYIRKHGIVKSGDVAVTGPGYLRCKHIVHAVGPRWKKHGLERSKQLLSKVFNNIYEAALQRGAKSFAMPAISSGIYGVPKEVCAKIVFEFLDEVDRKLAADPSTQPFEIHIVNIDEEIAKVFAREFHSWSLKGRKVQRRHSFDSKKSLQTEKKPSVVQSTDDLHKVPRIKSSLLPSVAGNPGGTTSLPADKRRSTSAVNGVSSATSIQSETFTNLQGTRNYSQDMRSASSLSAANPSARPESGAVAVDCAICRSVYVDPVSLGKCGHTFCKSCIDKAFCYKKKCPVCQEVYGVLEGNQPPGTMEVAVSSKGLPGYETAGCYVITYDIPSGYQGNTHPKPGCEFEGTRRQAYLPATKEGEIVLKMLRKAFDRKLIFTVGKSNTTGLENCVTWNDIHHKTSVNGGPQSFGYPDAHYLRRVKDELEAKGITPD